MKPINLLYYGIALIAPILIFVVWGNNLNERQPILVYVVCWLLFVLAGNFSVPGDYTTPSKVKWILWSSFVGIVEATLLVFLA